LKYTTIPLGDSLELTNGVSVAGRRWVVRHVGTKRMILNIDVDVTDVTMLRAIADEIDAFENPTPAEPGPIEPEPSEEATPKPSTGPPADGVEALDLTEKVIGHLKAGGVLTIEAAKAHEDLTKLPQIGSATAEDIAIAIAIFEEPNTSE